MRRGRIVKDKDWCRYLFDVMDNISAEQKSQLDSSELKQLANPRQMKKFAENVNLEDQLIFLSKIGIDFALVTFATGTEIEKGIREKVLDPETYAQKRLETLKKLREGKMFVVSNTNVLHAFHMAAMNTHHKAYLFNARFDALIKHGKDDREVKSFMDKTDDLKHQVDTISMLTIGALAVIQKSESIFGVTTAQMEILLTLYPYRNDFVSRETIVEMLGNKYNRIGVSRVCATLVDSNYLMRQNATHNKRPFFYNFTITRQGVDVVMKYMKYIADQMSK